MNQLLCLGFGFSARALAAQLTTAPTSSQCSITGTATSEAGVARIKAAGFDGILFDGKGPSQALFDGIMRATHVLVSVPPGENGDPVLTVLGHDLLRAPDLAWIGYLSTIGVYGDHGGGWVDEDTPARPQSERSQRRRAAEQDWQAFADTVRLGKNGPRLSIFRLSGIYGPGRSAIDNIRDRSARSIIKPGQVFNRIHVDDIAQTVAADMVRAGPGVPVQAVYNVTDDEPSPSHEVNDYAARLLGVAPPPAVALADAALSPMGASFYAENKRVRNDRIKRVLGVELKYPSYREGMQAVLAAGRP